MAREEKEEEEKDKQRKRKREKETRIDETSSLICSSPLHFSILINFTDRPCEPQRELIGGWLRLWTAGERQTLRERPRGEEGTVSCEPYVATSVPGKGVRISRDSTDFSTCPTNQSGVYLRRSLT
jgi:hypothetical protein